jgi:hypothetical protein
MSFPKHCISVMFIDMPVNPITNRLPLLYLPFKKTKSYFKHFPNSKGHKYLYIRFSNLPKEIQDVLQQMWKHLNYYVYGFLNPQTDELLGNHSLAFLNECLNNFEEKRQLEKWIRIIRKTKKWDRTHSIFGKYIIVCSFLFHFAVSAHSLKTQFRLFSGKNGGFVKNN